MLYWNLRIVDLKGVLIVCSPVTIGTFVVLAGGGVSRAPASAAASLASRARAPRAACASHDDGNYLLYVSVDTVIRGLISHNPAHLPQ